MFPFSKLPKAGLGRHQQRSTEAFERLEGRQLLSASAADVPCGPGGRTLDSIVFSMAPAAVQTGLNALATTDGLADPAATDTVRLGNREGVETYSVTIRSTGTVSKLTVDAAGNPVTAPTQSTTTFGALASAPAAEITAIAAAKSLTAPTSTTVVNVTTTSAGAVTYSVALTGTTTATPVASTADVNLGTIMWASPVAHGFTVRVDAAGNPVGNQQLPFSVFSSTIQSALNAGAPTGATALAATSTQSVAVRTSDGITTYSTTFTTSGTDATVTVDAAGQAVTAASRTTAAFSAIPAAAQTALQALAAAEGYGGTIATTQTVTSLTETGGTTTLYSVTLSVTGTSSTTSAAATHDETFVVDAAGNPTTTAMDAGVGGPFGGDPGFGGDGHGGGGRGGHRGPPADSTGGDLSSSGSSSTVGTVTSAKASGATATLASVTSGVLASALTSVVPTAPTLGASIGLFASALTNVTVLADVVQLRADVATLKADVKGLSKAQAATLKADEKAIATAIKAMGRTLSPGEKTLRADNAKYAALLKTDQKAVAKAGSDATALSAAKAKLATDKATAYAALSADLDALRSLIEVDAGVTAARAKLAADLPTVAAAQDTVVSDYTTLEKDVGTALTA